jgi:S-adenosylmethionine:tRNA ribosyltransferase-isomerase
MEHLLIDNYDYNLPEEKIAKYPLEQRDQSKLLVWKNGSITDNTFCNLPDLLPGNSLLVFNNTRVIRARLLFHKLTGATIEIFLLEPHSPSDYAQNFQQTNSCSWYCVVGNLKKWKSGQLIMPVPVNGQTVNLTAENTGNNTISQIICFTWDNSSVNFSDLIEAAGKIPIPPYLHRESEESDIVRYQTVYSKIKGSVAAPTAGLHFTDKVFESLKTHKIKVAETTLHVGAGTFQPVKSNEVSDHEMHTEHMVISRSFIEQLINHKGKIIAVGTTSVRILESLYWLGCKIIGQPTLPIDQLTVLQWEPYKQENEISKYDSLKALLGYMVHGNITYVNASTQIIIVPGYSFKITDGLITNFHQPKSTLLLLISAYVGEDWKTIYNHALNHNYRFLSYGDSNLYLKD